MSKQQISFVVGLGGVLLSPFLFELVSNLIQSYGPTAAKVKISRVHHLAFWGLSFIWAVYFGIWVWRANWSWFSTGNLKGKFGWILLGAFIVRLAVVTVSDAPLSSDAVDYDRLATTLVQTGSYQENGTLTAYRPIGYVAFLGGIYKIFGHHIFLPKLINVLMDIFSLLLLRQIFALWKDKATALKAVTVVAFYPPLVYTTQNLLSEHLFSFLWILCIYFWERSGAKKTLSFFSGLSFGLSALVRPVVLAWGVLLIVLAFKKRRWACLAGFLLMAAAVTVPWFYRNHHKFGVWALSTHAGFGFWMGANPQANGYYHLPDSLPFDFSNEREMSQASWKLGWEFVKNHPWQYLKLGVVKEIVIFGFDYTCFFTTLVEKPPYAQLVWGILGEVFWWILLGFAATKTMLVLFNRRKREGVGSLLPIWTLLYWVAVHFFFVGTDRYHHPVVPFFAFLAVLPFTKRNEGDRPGLAGGNDSSVQS